MSYGQPIADDLAKQSTNTGDRLCESVVEEPELNIMPKFCIRYHLYSVIMMTLISRFIHKKLSYRS